MDRERSLEVIDKLLGDPAQHGYRPVWSCGIIRQSRQMNKSTVIAKLREHEPELKAAGILRLSVFGSVARGDESAKSDVDLMAEFDRTKQLSMIDMVGLENRLADILGVPVDLAPAKELKGGIRDRATREAVLAF
jgi:uncharacterized protein